MTSPKKPGPKKPGPDNPTAKKPKRPAHTELRRAPKADTDPATPPVPPSPPAPLARPDDDGPEDLFNDLPV
ncbi:MAG: hypothetical protein RLZZ491_1734 [Pseudomonadota bacterium]|jgi:hypothetical protein